MSEHRSSEHRSRIKLADSQNRLRVHHILQLMARKSPDPDEPIDYWEALERMMLDQQNINHVLALDPTIQNLLEIRHRNRAWAEYWAVHDPFDPESYQRLVEELRELEKSNAEKATRRLRKQGVYPLESEALMNKRKQTNKGAGR